MGVHRDAGAWHNSMRIDCALLIVCFPTDSKPHNCMYRVNTKYFVLYVVLNTRYSSIAPHCCHAEKRHCVWCVYDMILYVCVEFLGTSLQLSVQVGGPAGVAKLKRKIEQEAFTAVAYLFLFMIQHLIHEKYIRNCVYRSIALLLCCIGC